jgi:hypothetical protein
MVGPRAQPLAKGDMVKRRVSGGHVMTVIRLDRVNGTVVTGYTTADGEQREEEWRAADLKRMDL